MSNTRRSNVERWISAFAVYIAPATVVIALLYYFGYVRSAALYAYFGLDLGALDLSDQDYLIRGVDALYVPLGCLMLIILAGVWSHWLVERAVARGGYETTARRAAFAGIGLGVVLFFAGILGIARPDWSLPLITPLCVGGGVIVAASSLRIVFALRRVDSSGLPYRASAVLLSGLVVLSVFWTANEYAQAYGTGRAETLSLELRDRPAVILDTKDRLFADAPGIRETALNEAGTYRFRYRGYRLFAQSDTTILLIPENWTTREGAIWSYRIAMRYASSFALREDASTVLGEPHTPLKVVERIIACRAVSQGHVVDLTEVGCPETCDQAAPARCGG